MELKLLLLLRHQFPSDSLGGGPNKFRDTLFCELGASHDDVLLLLGHLDFDAVTRCRGFALDRFHELLVSMTLAGLNDLGHVTVIPQTVKSVEGKNLPPEKLKTLKHSIPLEAIWS